MARFPAAGTAVILDTSVILKWFRREEVLAEEALALRDAYLSGEMPIVVPTLLTWELANVLRFKRDWSEEEVRVAVGTLFDMGLEWVPPEPSLVNRAIDLAFAHGTTLYDAAFAALAEARGLVLVTADNRLIEKLAGFPWIRRLG